MEPDTSLRIVPVKGRSMLMKFIRFPLDLYKNCPQWVPSFESDEINSLSEKNPSLSFCERELYLAFRGKTVVGRVAAIINHQANDKWGEKVARFGWIDFVEDFEVAKVLIDTVVAWGRSKGAEKIKGPLGFTDMDREGLLVEGFEYDSPFTVIYNFPYYGEYLERLGFTKDADWTQRYIDLPDTLPPMFQYADLVEKRYGVHIIVPKNRKEMVRYGREMFHVLNDAFAPLYEYSKLSDEQIDSYVKQYVPVLNKDYIALAVNEEGKLVGFTVTMPSISRAVRKAKGRLFPFGFIPILKALRTNKTLEALLIGVLPEYQAKGAALLMFKYLHENCIRLGVKRLLLNPQLEENYKVQTLFEQYNPQLFQRRRSYVKVL
ncbi:MAG: N-acetyltransferase [Bacteroidales bacterium]|nr:N-acetyltransferase [Bacteroidales bacterium]